MASMLVGRLIQFETVVAEVGRQVDDLYAHVMEQADQKNADILANVFLKNG